MSAQDAIALITGVLGLAMLIKPGINWLSKKKLSVRDTIINVVSVAVAILLISAVAWGPNLIVTIFATKSPTPTSRSPHLGITLSPNPTIIALSPGGQSPSPTVAASIPTATPTPTPYYQANWSQGLDNWSPATDATDWSSNDGMLVANGQENNAWIFAPQQIQFASYTLTVKIRWEKYTNAGGPSFGVVVRYIAGSGGYVCGTGDVNTPYHYFLALGSMRNGHPSINHDLNSSPPPPTPVDQQWHTYRVDVQENNMTLSVDGNVIFSDISDSTYSDSGIGQVGLYASAAIIDAEDFVVSPLE